MSFTWPFALALIVAPAVLLAVYLWTLRRRRRQAVRWSSVALLREALPPSSRWRRHVPAALILAGLVLLAVAAARPAIARQVAVGRTSIILALDVSNSMCATDVDPNRLAAAQDAAAKFVLDQPEGTRIGIVAFSGFAEVTTAPTRDRDALAEAIKGLTTGRGTAIGAAILKSLDAVAEVNPAVAPVGDTSSDTSIDAPSSGPTASPPPEDFVPDIIVLLSDGRNTRGIEPLDAVPYAQERKVRVFTIGFGTTQPSTMACSASQLGSAALTPSFGGGGGGDRGFGGGFSGGGFRGALVADEETLREVATQTGGTYHAAVDAGQLNKVFADLPKQFDRQEEQQEITWVLAALGAMCVLGALVTSFRLSPYP